METIGYIGEVQIGREYGGVWIHLKCSVVEEDEKIITQELLEKDDIELHKLRKYTPSINDDEEKNAFGEKISNIKYFGDRSGLVNGTIVYIEKKELKKKNGGKEPAFSFIYRKIYDDSASLTEEKEDYYYYNSYNGNLTILSKAYDNPVTGVRYLSIPNKNSKKTKDEFIYYDIINGEIVSTGMVIFPEYDYVFYSENSSIKSNFTFIEIVKNNLSKRIKYSSQKVINRYLLEINNGEELEDIKEYALVYKGYLKNKKDKENDEYTSTLGAVSTKFAEAPSLINFLILFTQKSMMIISGETGSGRVSGIRSFGEKIGINSDKLIENRFFELPAKSEWTDTASFRDSIYNDFGAHMAMIMLNAEKTMAIKNKPPVIGLVKRAHTSSIEKYFQDFLYFDPLHKDFNTTGFSDADLKYYTKNLRWIFSIDENYSNGCLDHEVLKKSYVMDYEDIDFSILGNVSKVTLEDLVAIFGNENSKCELQKEDKELIEEIERLISEFVKVDNHYLDIPPMVNKDIARYIETAVGLNMDKITALDYAVSQRIIPFVTQIKGRVTISNNEEILEFLRNNKLTRSEKKLSTAIKRGRVTISDENTDRFNDEYIIKQISSYYNKIFEDETKLFDTESDIEEVIDHICKIVNLERDNRVYTRNVIVNMLICLSQGFLTVFSGKPGCGKTSICRILGKALGLTNSGSGELLEFDAFESFEDRRHNLVNPSRYLEVSTERGWTSKRDFIGYYNPLTEQFDKVNALLYNMFLVLDSEARETKKDHLPCFVLLDEANLSPMEFYWADFMNLCEAWKESNSIDLGGGHSFKIPEQVHFIATINNDHTTEILSPRLIDRANVIDLPISKGYEMISVDEDELDELSIESISWQTLKKCFCVKDREDGLSDDENIAIKKSYEDIKKFVMDKFFISMSPRTDIAVSKYFTVAAKCFEETEYTKEISEKDENSKSTWDEIESQFDERFKSEFMSDEEEHCVKVVVSPAENAMDYAIAQRVLPKITDVSGNEAIDDFVELYELFVKNHFFKSADLIVDIVQRGYKTEFYNYFR